MAMTRLGAEQAKLKSSRTGEHSLDDYLEACEKGDRALFDLLDDLFDVDGVFRGALFEFREEPSTTGQLQVRVGTFTDPEEGWVNVDSTGIISVLEEVTDANDGAAASAAAALTSENNSATHEANAALYAAKLAGTSTTSNSIAVASKSFTTQANKFFDVGNWVMITDNANSANYMHGQVTAYSGTSLTVNVTTTGGSGTISDWNIRLSGAKGATGPSGTGDMLSTNNLSELTNTATARSNLGLVIGTNVQAYDATLGTIAALNPTTNEAIYFTGTNTASVYTTSAGGRALANATGTSTTIPYFSGTNTVGNLSFLNESDMSSNSSVAVPTQSSVKAYVDARVSTITQNSKSTAYTLVLADAGKHILHPSADTTARTFTIPANSSVAYPIGTAITFVNQNSAGVVTISINTDTMRLAGAGTTGSRTLAANGVATALKITSTEWIISGTGLT